MPWQIVTPPVLEPVTLLQAKAHLRVDVPDEDSLISDIITAAREDLEDNYELAFITQTWDMFMDSFPGLNLTPLASLWQLSFNKPIEIPKPPLQSVTSVTYYDTTGTPTVFPAANYIVDTASYVGRIGLKQGLTWPSTTLQPINGVVVRCKLGFGDTPAAMPFKARQATLLMIGHYYLNREQVLLEQRVRAVDIPKGVDDLMAPLNWRAFVA